MLALLTLLIQIMCIFYPIYSATITTQPSDVTVCTGGVAVFTCVMDRNGTNITSDDVMWQQIRPEGSTSTLSTSLGGLPFIIITTISGDILNSTLTVRGVAVGNALGTSLYRCVVPVSNMKSRNASLQFSTGTTSMRIYRHTVVLCGQKNHGVSLIDVVSYMYRITIVNFMPRKVRESTCIP